MANTAHRGRTHGGLVRQEIEIVHHAERGEKGVVDHNPDRKPWPKALRLISRNALACGLTPLTIDVKKYSSCSA